MTKTRYPNTWLVLLALSAGPGAAADDESAAGIVPADSPLNETPGEEIDTSRWPCRFCPDYADENWQVEIELGAAWVSDDSFKFGEYNGLADEGFYPALGIDAQYLDETTNYLDLRAANLGLDAARVDLEGGSRGRYRLGLLLDQLQRNQIDNAATPYRGDSTLALPAGWVPGSTTAGMTTLQSDLEDIDFSTRRRTLQLDGRILQGARWSYDARFERQTREGTVPFGAAIGTTFADARAAILAKPVDYVTDRFELAANYRDKTVVGTLSYVVSTFDNANSALQWDNAFSVGSDSGQLALEPDNEMQRISAAGQYRGFETVTLNGSLSFARLTQNDRFLPFTVNGVVAAPPLPRESLDGSVDVTRANASALWTISPLAQARFSYEYFEHVDDSDRATYGYVVADNALSGAPRANVPYDFRNQKLRAEANYRLPRNDRIGGGIDYGVSDRTYQAVDRTSEKRVWASYRKRTSAGVDYRLEIEAAAREADGYDALAELIPPENPRLRKYHLADRERTGAALDVDFLAGERWVVTVVVDLSRADYADSAVGLSESAERSIGTDLQYLLSDEISITGYLHRSTIESTQHGSSVGGEPDWTVDNEDRSATLGVGFTYTPANTPFRLGADYSRTDSTGETRFSQPAATSLPDLESELASVEIFTEYDYSDNLSYRASYTYETYDEKDWSLDGVAPDTIDNVLTLGETAPDYRISLLWLTLRYRF